jgi:amidase
MMPRQVVHAFGDDALGELDAVGLAARIRRGEVSAREVTAAAIARAQRVEPQLGAIQIAAYDAARHAANCCGQGMFSGVPSFVKDNTDLAGWPTTYGSCAVPVRPAARDGAFSRQFLAQGFVVLGKSTTPEFGLNASTEFRDRAPTRNPWSLAHSCGASSGGAAALVASGVVPLAHANDGGGSIRIPAACCGLVGLKPTRGRLVDGEAARALPLNIIGEGVLTRSVRDTAHFFHYAESFYRNPALLPVGRVERPLRRRLKIGFYLDSVSGHATDSDTRAAVTATASLLEQLGHRVESMPPPGGARFAHDFSVYWGGLAYLVARFGERSFGPGFDASQLDAFSRGLVAFYKRYWPQTLGVLHRLKCSARDYARVFDRYDIVLSPVLAHVTPELGHLSPEQPFEQLFERLHRYVGFTPWNNAAGGPALSLPLGRSSAGLPIGVHFSAAHGDERTLLELAFELEYAAPWPRLTD